MEGKGGKGGKGGSWEGRRPLPPLCSGLGEGASPAPTRGGGKCTPTIYMPPTPGTETPMDRLPSRHNPPPGTGIPSETPRGTQRPLLKSPLSLPRLADPPLHAHPGGILKPTRMLQTLPPMHPPWRQPGAPTKPPVGSQPTPGGALGTWGGDRRCRWAARPRCPLGPCPCATLCWVWPCWPQYAGRGVRRVQRCL